MPTAYCEESDVQAALMESDAKFGTAPLDSANVTTAIHGASSWFQRRSNAHFYDSGGSTTLVDTTTISGTTTESVPASPHRQSGQIWQVSERGVQQMYPNTHSGQYVRIKLPYRFVDSVDTLDVADDAGDVTDWVASSEFTQGRGEDYWLRVDGERSASLGQSYLYLRAGSLGAHLSFEDILEITVSYGLDYQDTPWDDVQRGIAALAASQLLSDEDILGGLPDNADLPGYDTLVSRLSGQALSLAENAGGYLSPYLKVPVV